MCHQRIQQVKTVRYYLRIKNLIKMYNEDFRYQSSKSLAIPN